MPDIKAPNAFYAKVVPKAWSDPAFKAKLLANPASLLAAAGVEVPPGVTVKVVEDTDRLVHLVLPPRPDGQELSEEKLDMVAAGSWIETVNCPYPPTLPKITLQCPPLKML